MSYLTHRQGWRIAALALVAAGLAACGGGGGGHAVINTPAPAKLEDGFGAGFGALFRAAPNTEAARPQPGDLKAVDPTASPTPLH
jgi:hypothetical protein